VALAMKLGVQMTINGAFLVPLWSLPPISVHQTMPYQTMKVVGVILLSNILILLNLFFFVLLNTKLELFL
jgi:hypothetical protein